MIRFSADHVSFSQVEDSWVLALAETSDASGSSKHILVSFAEQEQRQDVELGLTGLFVAVAPDQEKSRGYGLVERVDYDGEAITIYGSDGFEGAEVQIAAKLMTSDEIKAAVERCNLANKSRPRS